MKLCFFYYTVCVVMEAIQYYSLNSLKGCQDRFSVWEMSVLSWHKPENKEIHEAFLQHCHSVI